MFFIQSGQRSKMGNESTYNCNALKLVSDLWLQLDTYDPYHVNGILNIIQGNGHDFCDLHEMGDLK